MIKKEKILSVREQIADQIRSDIISGDLPPDTKLNEQALADRFGVSRGPIRDVLLQLTKEGLLVTRANVGASVNTMLSPEKQKLMVDIRRRIETFAARRLIDEMTEDDFKNLDKILQSFEQAFRERDFTAVTKADIDFHRYLVEKAGGEELVNLWYPVVMRMRMNYKRLDDAAHGVDEHRAIVDALRDGDSKVAVAALRTNIR